MTGVRLVVVGDALLDRDVEGLVERLSPDAPVPVLEQRTVRSRPGGAALAASLAAGDGLDVALVTTIGDDEPGRELRLLLEADGVEILGPIHAGATPEKIRLLAGDQPLLRLDRGTAPTPGSAMPTQAAAMAAPVLARVHDADVVVVADYGRGLTARPELRRALAARRRPTLWDPHPRGSAPSPGAALVTPNRSELGRLLGGPVEGLPAVAERTAAARRQWQARAVATTLGAEGVLLVDSDGPPLVVPVAPVSGRDSCGAGDRFITATAARLLDGALLSEAVIDAAAAATCFVAAGGARSRWSSSESPVSRAAPHRSDGPPPTAPRHEETGLRTAESVAESVRSAGGTVVVAGGCFDLLHAGHVTLLEAARRLGDCLIVALNSDASVRRLKGPGRPVVPQDDRAALLCALGCVDAVAVFDDDTPVALLERLRPHVFAKGGDYSARSLPEQEIIGRWGGQAVVLPYLSGRSTTGLLQVVGDLP